MTNEEKSKCFEKILSAMQIINSMEFNGDKQFEMATERTKAMVSLNMISLILQSTKTDPTY